MNPAGLWIFLPSFNVAFFELTKSPENRGLVLSRQSLMSHYSTGAIMYYMIEEPILECNKKHKLNLSIVKSVLTMENSKMLMVLKGYPFSLNLKA